MRAPSPAGRPCPQCGYDLTGLPADGSCPECGVPVARSMKGPLLRFASEEYLAAVHRGVFLVLAGIIAQILIVIGGFIGALIARGAVFGNLVRAAEALSSIGSTLATVAVLWGWWLVSTPDPGVQARWDARTARRWVRVTAIVQVGAVVLGFFGSLMPGTQPGVLGPWLILSMLIGLLSLAFWAAAFFAQMVYIRWLARRVPNPRVVRRAELLMWLGPVLVTVGAVLLMIGPLVALILYWNMLEWVRLDLKRTRRGRSAHAHAAATPA